MDCVGGHPFREGPQAVHPSEDLWRALELSTFDGIVYHEPGTSQNISGLLSV